MHSPISTSDQNLEQECQILLFNSISQHDMVAEWSRAPTISSRKQGDVCSSPNPAKIPFSDENFLDNSRV